MKVLIDANDYKIVVISHRQDSIEVVVSKNEENIHRIYQENNSTFIHDGQEYDLNKLFIKAESLPIEKLPLYKLDWIIQFTDVDDDRVQDADINIPILVTKWRGEWVVLDGIHRLVKSKKIGKKTIKSKIISQKDLNSVKL